MSKKKATTKEYVTHPRYGSKPSKSDFIYSEYEILNSYWGYDKNFIFPESAIKADINKQNYSTFPREMYVDIEKQCIQCKRWFIFYAVEQKFWYEILKLYIDVDCIKCIDCRKKEQSIKQKLHDYEMLLRNKNRTEKDNKNLKNIALELFQLGYIRDKRKIDTIE